MVEDHAIVRAGFHRMLVDAFPDLVFGEASSAREALAAVRDAFWDIVVLDLSLPGASGLDVLAELRLVAPQVPVLIMTMYGESEYAVRAFRGGASGYITKGSAPEQILEAVRKVLSGGRYVSGDLAEQLAGGLSADASRPLHESLSSREFQVFRMLAAGMTVKGIGHELHLSHKTVSTYRSRVLYKMQLGSTAELMRYAHRMSLVD